MVEELEKDDLVSDNLLFKKVFEEVKNTLAKPDFDLWKFFVNHPNNEVSQLAIGVLTDKHKESKIWKKGGAFAEDEEEILDLLVPKVINEYKSKKIRLMLPHIEDEINKAYLANDFDRVIEEQSKYMNLKQVQKDLSDKLGSRMIN